MAVTKPSSLISPQVMTQWHENKDLRTCLLQTRFLRRQAIRTYNLVVPRGAGSDKVRLHGLQAGPLARLAPKDLPQTPRICHAFPGTRGTEVHAKRIAVIGP